MDKTSAAATICSPLDIECTNVVRQNRSGRGDVGDWDLPTITS